MVHVVKHGIRTHIYSHIYIYMTLLLGIPPKFFVPKIDLWLPTLTSQVRYRGQAGAPALQPGGRHRQYGAANFLGDQKLMGDLSHITSIFHPLIGI